MTKRIFLSLLSSLIFLNSNSLFGQSDISEGEQIDFVYKKFSEGYTNLDPLLVSECYTNNSVEISHYLGKAPKIIDGKKAITNDFTDFFISLKKQNKKVSIDFLISKRTITNKKAYDIGFYKLTSTDSIGKAKISYGKIAIILIKEKRGNWKFLTDTNSSSNEDEYGQANSSTAPITMSSRIDSLFTTFLDSGLAGSLIVAEKGIITLQKAYGYANNETKKLNTINTLFNVASIGKQFTVFAILQLEKEGKLKTSDYLSKYIGNFGDVRDSITIQHLLIHRAGIVQKDYELIYTSREKYVQSVKTAPPDAFEPGKGYRYSNAGFSMLAAVVEIASGSSFEEYLYKNIFKPFNMTSTGYPWEQRIDKSLLATGYNSKKEPLPVQENIWAARGPGNIVTTMTDLYKWITAYKSKDFLTPSLKDKIFANYYPSEESFGFTKTSTKRNTKFIHKGGGRPDFESRLMWFTDDDVIVIFSLNNDYNIARQLFSKITNFMD
jgi:CubicO group peptidase (beta-lactamase class C family)/ketosteroid isomerase-like protein